MSIAFNTSDNTAQNHFINPPEPGLSNQYQDNNVYVLGSTIDLSWQTNYTDIQILLWQNGNSSTQLLPQSVLRQVSNNSAAWDVDLEGLFSLKHGNVFFFWIIPSKVLESDNPDPAHFSSHYFNISDPSSTRPGASSKTSASQKQTSSNGNTNGTALGVGIGVGVGVFVLLLLGAAFWIWRKRRSRSKSQLPKDPAFNGESITGGHAQLSEPKNQPNSLREGMSELTTEGNGYNELPAYPPAPYEMSTSSK